ncbi:hypothetical protein [Undibacterium sp. Di24W]|uniref:hypothetical protein n=1 Tax=Undibacterium sp. Di24W TaxID=3413033 RepID=UPI003BF3E332
MRILSKLLVVLAAMFLPQISIACSCLGPGHYDVIFEGIVTSIREDKTKMNTDRYAEVRFEVVRTIKGKNKKEIVVYTGNSLMCGAVYEVGKKYVIYAIDKSYLETKFCYGKELQ